MEKMILNRRAALASLALAGIVPSLWAQQGAFVLPLILAQNAPSKIDPLGYLVSEKLDGVRAIWDGKALRFRSGRTIAAPQWFLDKLPATPLDGELWAGRGRFDALSGIVRKGAPMDDEWRRVAYWVFELPEVNKVSSNTQFSERSATLRALVQTAAWSQLRWVEQKVVANNAELQLWLKGVVTGGGEGLILHWGQAPVVDGRSALLLKLKPLFDAQAVVLSYIEGKGKNAGKMGSLVVQTNQGMQFRLGSGFSAAQRSAPPAVGSTVVFTYRDTTPTGKPRFASFVRVQEAE